MAKDCAGVSGIVAFHSLCRCRGKGGSQVFFESPEGFRKHLALGSSASLTGDIWRISGKCQDDM